jgi:zinc transporter, ZIP family
MKDVLEIILFASVAGLPIIIGGGLSSIFQTKKWKLKSEINHIIIAFGGGALLSAVSFALIPRALNDLNYGALIIIFLAGTFTFMTIDFLIGKSKGSLAQAMSMMMDFIPEALALGASFALDHKFGLLLALFIGLQNLPEGFNSYIELRKNLTRSKTLWIMFALSFVGIAAALAGKFLLAESPKAISAILLFAGGGILYLIFQDIAPLSRRRKDWIPASGASFGFLLGMLAEKLLH